MARPGGNQSHYKAVGETVGLKPQKVKEVGEAMMAVAAIELRVVGTFKIAGAVSMKLKKPARPKKLVRLTKLGRLFVCKSRRAHNIVAMKITKKYRKEIEKTCGDELIGTRKDDDRGGLRRMN